MRGLNSLIRAASFVILGIGIGWTINSVRADADKPAYVYEF